MDIIELARSLGGEIQRDESYIRMRAAEQVSEDDEKLQELIEDYNIKRLEINVEAAKTDRDDEKMQALNKEMRSIYADIMQNENMKAYEKAKKEFDAKLSRIMTIIQNCAMGADPDAADSLGGGCTGSCSTCGGCG